ncbi:DUF3597 domain-containing protein [Ramlibacter tataouinensis]|uniref:DUF3597 domain-containing protein n=1 Tax=Ramlibacter tataouinensis (strain ATCC BAA-407 / DSM 14655 / LMG 21543 / TTB310) TaxID=365046 RepID=F5XXE6_RAMTT|nr:DUF3597 domain-containing protein [Ramlibacter tataouinensis]AEG94281.1 conserved hypothetical protein [Ramlibacter tataouinensis TTB310]
MSILGKIFGRIFPKANAAQAPAASPTPAAAASQPNPAVVPPQQQPATNAAAAGAGPATATIERVDIEQVLEGLAAKNPQKLNWRNSIVDLMKLVGMDSTLQERRELADELGYTGDKGDSAAMNIWLHKQVMRRLAENGGKVPADLMD